MAKKLSIKFTSSSSSSPGSSQMAHPQPQPPSPELLAEFANNNVAFVDDLTDNDSVHLISVIDEDSEDNSESYSEFISPGQLKQSEVRLCSVAQDEIDMIDAKILHQKQLETNKKKSSGNKMDKLMRQIQVALTPSSSESKLSDKNKESDTEDPSPNASQQTSSNSNKSTNSTSGQTNSSNWLNDKFGNFVNLNKLRNDKPKTNNNDSNDSGSESRKMSLAIGVKNHLISPTSNDGNQNQVASIENYMANENDDNHSFGKQTPVSFSNLLNTFNETNDPVTLASIPSIDDFSDFNMKDNKKPKATEQKEQKKKFTLFDKKTFNINKDDSKSNNLAKLISPTKTVPLQSSSLASALVSPTTNMASTNIPSSSNNSQVLSNFLSTFTSNSSNKTINNSTSNTNISSSRSASTENVHTTTGDANNNNSSSSKNKPKIPASKSMMTFRKSTKNDDMNGEEDFSCLLSSFLATTSSTPNPTLRRRAKSSNSPRQGSPTPEESGGGRSSESSSSSSSSTAINYQSTEFPEQPEQKQPNAIKLDINSQQPLSLWNSMTSTLSFHYYIFMFMAVSSVFFLCISPLPSFLNGFIFGFLMTFFIMTIGIVYLVANFFLIKSDDKQRRSTNESVGLKRTKSKKLAVNLPISTNDGTIYAGWVYEFIGNYSEREKNGFVSRLVYVVLQKSRLSIFVPSQEMNEKKLKQLSCDRNMPTCLFVTSQHRVIDFNKIHHKRISLYLTKNVRNQRKYIWSKKYPICIEYNEDRNDIVTKDENLQESQYLQTPTSTPIISKLVIFARTCREKEEWFWAIKTSIDSTINYKISNSTRGSTNSLADSPSDSQKTYLFVSGNEVQTSDGDNIITSTQQQYLHILTRRNNYNNFMRTNILNAEGIGPGNHGMMTALTWFNVLLNRLSFDILNKPNWSAYIAKKLQRKLKKLRLPYFMESLTITEIDIGSALPKFNSVPSVPQVDDAGLWIEFDVNYSGGFTMTLETKINLLKLSANVENLEVSPASTPNDSPKFTQKIGGRYWSGYRAKCRPGTGVGSQSPGPGTEINPNDEVCEYDSDIDSIVTSSEDEEPETAPAAPDDADADEKQKKFVRFVEKITTSQYFQKASQMNFFKKALEGVSNMSIMLTVQINSLVGTLAINIPEPPTDRLWYGFRNDPSIQITARPKLGDHDLNLSYVTNFIEKKLRTEFFNYFVIPNMDDFFIPALNTSIEQYINVVP